MLDLAELRRPEPERAGPLGPQERIAVEGVAVSPGPALDRLSLRGAAAAFAAVARLPEAVGAVEAQGRLTLLCLGPDEWLALAPADDLDLDTLRRIETADGVSVDIGHRQVALRLEGPAAETLLSAGCPLDLHPSVFAPGRCTRTVFGKAEIVLWRDAPDRFHVEVARSFAAYVWALLAEAAPLLPRP